MEFPFIHSFLIYMEASMLHVSPMAEGKRSFVEPQLTPHGSWQELTGGGAYQCSGYQKSGYQQSGYKNSYK